MTVGRDAWRHLGPFLRPEEEVCQGFRCRCTPLARGGATLEISLHPRLVASDVSISKWPGAGSAPLATAKQVAVQLHFLPLLSGRYEVTRLELVEPVIALATDAEGRGNWEFDMVAALGGACLFGKRRGRRTLAMSAFGRQQRPLRVVTSG